MLWQGYRMCRSVSKQSIVMGTDIAKILHIINDVALRVDHFVDGFLSLLFGI